ncbi:MAG: NosD domain-containing protein, partial [Candidatus Njordarchaeota archaeon]
MGNKCKLLNLLFLLLVATLISVAFYSVSSKAVEIQPRTIIGTAPPASGDWNISDITIVEDEDLVINGSINIQSGGALILRRSTIRMNIGYDGQFVINVASGGNLTIINSTITSYNTSYYYQIIAESGAVFYGENSEIDYIGYGNNFGLDIKADNIVIVNCSFFNTSRTIRIDYANNVFLDRLIFNNSYTYAICVQGSNNVTIKRSKIDKTWWGIYFDGAHNCSVNDSWIRTPKSYPGIRLYSSSNVKIINNTLYGGGIEIYGKDSTVKHIIENNTLNDEPILYIYNQSVLIENQKLGQLIITMSNNCTIRNVTINSGFRAISLIQVNASRVIKVAIIGATYSVHLMHCFGDEVINSSFQGGSYSMGTRYSENISFRCNNVSLSYYGAWIYRSTSIIIQDNILDAYLFGANIDSSDSVHILHNYIDSKNGVHALYSTHVVVEENDLSYTTNGTTFFKTNRSEILGNDISGGQNGISIMSSIDNIVYNNNVSKCSMYGIYLQNTENNTIYWNNFFQNNKNAYDLSANNFNYTTIGNYWSDYNGTDNNTDGIGDTPYYIDNDSIDYYPLIYPTYLYDDQDNDSLPEWEEGQYNTDPLDNDTDDDGVSDGWEVSNGTDPLDNDTDDDGLIDG